MKCLECELEIEPSGMCCNSGANSGYQCFCEKCKIIYVNTFDGRILVDTFLTLTALKRAIEQS